MAVDEDPIYGKCSKGRDKAMSGKLSDEERLAVVDYRLARARATLEETDYMRDGGFYNSAVNRLYYACYYAASALLVANGIEVMTHAGVRNQLYMHFVRTRRLSLDHSATFSLLFEKRHSGDYSDFVYCDFETVDVLRPRAEAFIDDVAGLLWA